MKKILLLIVTLFVISFASTEEKIVYESENVNYSCKNGFIEAEIKFSDGRTDIVKVKWVSPRENEKTVPLECDDFFMWVEETQQR